MPLSHPAASGSWTHHAHQLSLADGLIHLPKHGSPAAEMAPRDDEPTLVGQVEDVQIPESLTLMGIVDDEVEDIAVPGDAYTFADPPVLLSQLTQLLLCEGSVPRQQHELMLHLCNIGEPIDIEDHESGSPYDYCTNQGH